MKENEIRNRDVLDHYLKMVEDDCRVFFNDKEGFYEVNCPACGNSHYNSEFSKNGFDYVTCDSCKTLYARTRLSLDKLKQFYSQSSSTEYWIKEFFAPMAEARREKIFRPRAEYIVKTFGEDPKWLIGDIGAGFGIFLNELRRLWPASSYIAVEPSPMQADICKQLNLKVECCFLEELKGYDDSFGLLTAFELLEHLYDPDIFLSEVHRLLKPGGLILITTLNGEGFDFQILWERTKNIYPPCHINFFNPASITNLLASKGFYVEEVDTPGKLDWDIVEGQIKDGGVNAGRFWKLLAEKGSDSAKRSLQEWISANLLSSHMRILARRQK